MHCSFTAFFQLVSSWEHHLGTSRGDPETDVAFVQFVNQQDAERAVAALRKGLGVSTTWRLGQTLCDIKDIQKNKQRLLCLLHIVLYYLAHSESRIPQYPEFQHISRQKMSVKWMERWTVACWRGHSPLVASLGSMAGSRTDITLDITGDSKLSLIRTTTGNQRWPMAMKCHEMPWRMSEIEPVSQIESPNSKGWMRVLAHLRTISLQVSISGARLKMYEHVLFPESILQKTSWKRDARRMENPKKLCPNGLAQLCGWAQFYGLSKMLSTIFLLKKTNEKRSEPLRWVHTIETGT